MSKVLDATCEADGTVKVGDLEVPTAVVLSEGNQASSGLLVLEETRARYLTSSATDVKTTIEKVNVALTDLASALTEISSALTAIGAGMTGPTTAPPGSLPTSVATITAKVSAINATKSQLENLKDHLK